MKLSLFGLSLPQGSKRGRQMPGESECWLENETFQQCLRKARLQRGILQPLEEIAIQKEREVRWTAESESQLKTIELGDGFVATVDRVNRIVTVGGWAELGMFQFELGL